MAKRNSNSQIAAHEMSRLWQAHSIVALAADAAANRQMDDGPALSPALRAAEDLIKASIDAIEPLASEPIPGPPITRAKDAVRAAIYALNEAMRAETDDDLRTQYRECLGELGDALSHIKWDTKDHAND